MGVFLLIAAIIVLDQNTKLIIRMNFEVGGSLPVIQDVFHITYVQNRGAAFSLFQNMPLLTIAFPVVAMIVCAILMVQFMRRRERLITIALGLVLAGGLGNLIDRTVLGFVTDMLDFRVFPVFNVADISVCVGCGLIMIWLFFVEGKNAGTGETDGPDR